MHDQKEREDEAVRRAFGDVQMKTPSPNLFARSKPGRNEPCPCKSGKKFKKCCGPEYESWLKVQGAYVRKAL